MKKMLVVFAACMFAMCAFADEWKMPDWNEKSPKVWLDAYNSFDVETKDAVKIDERNTCKAMAEFLASDGSFESLVKAAEDNKLKLSVWQISMNTHLYMKESIAYETDLEFVNSRVKIYFYCRPFVSKHTGLSTEENFKGIVDILLKENCEFYTVGAGLDGIELFIDDIDENIVKTSLKRINRKYSGNLAKGDEAKKLWEPIIARIRTILSTF